ncbi:MAG: NnrS family protein [Alcanivorax sp.]|nr:NnrS family protein [Alcanivorax sp.]
MNIFALFASPFRIFFLSLSLWAIAAMLLWVASVTGLVSLSFSLSPLRWHQHEMLFAILNPAIAGFLLTAVCVWTNSERLHGLPLLLLWLVWLTGRLVTGVPLLPEALMIAINLLFLPLVMIDAGRRIIRARQARHAPILLVLLLLWLAQAAFLLQWSGHAMAMALIAASALMLVVGGRITPAFSGNWLRANGGDPQRIRNPLWLERLTLTAMLVLCLSLPFGNNALTAILALVAALISLSRIALWRGWLVRREPMLWILHLSLLWIPVGLVLLAGSRSGLWPDNVWIHAIGIGAMGALILGVISRVGLGHTGRPLTLPAGMVTAYVLLHASALIRVLTALQILPWQRGIEISAVLWVVAWLLFLVRYSGVLCSPRVDGKPG